MLSIQLAKMPETVCYMQTLSVNPVLMKLRMLREKPSNLIQTAILGSIDQQRAMLNISNNSSQEYQAAITGTESTGGGGTGFSK